MPGEHIITAASEDGVDQVQHIASVKGGMQKLVNIELYPLRLARIEAQQEAAAEAARVEQQRQEQEQLAREQEQEAAAKQPAVRQLQYITDALKHCPPDKYKLIEGGIMASQGGIVQKGPPENVDWRVELPFVLNLAIIAYDFPNYVEVEQPNLSTLCSQPGMTKKECGKLWQTTLDEYKRTMDEYKWTSTHPLQFKYEFSVTPDGLEYRRGFSKTDQTGYEEWKTLETPDWCARWAISSVLPQYHWD
jgi:hypothetical protein